MKPPNWLPGAAIALVSTLSLPVLAARPLKSDMAAGVFPPWWSQAQILSAADEAGAIVGLGAFPFIVIVRNEADDVGAQLHAAGSLLNLDPFGMAGCIKR